MISYEKKIHYCKKLIRVHICCLYINMMASGFRYVGFCISCTTSKESCPAHGVSSPSSVYIAVFPPSYILYLFPLCSHY